jgi:sugar/nucleoside kinase (ribokinase family)
VVRSGVDHVLVSVGPLGLIHGTAAAAHITTTDDGNMEGIGVTVTHYAAAPVGRVVNTNGAGDSFVGACAAAIAGGACVEEAIERGLLAAALSVGSSSAVAL